MPLAQQAELARPNQPQYAYDPSLVRHPFQPRESFINDLRAMGGREARQLTFGATFGATSGFLMARFLMSLLKLAVLVGIVFGFIVIARLSHMASDQTTPAPVLARPVRHVLRVQPAIVDADSIAISPDNPYALVNSEFPNLPPEEADAARRQLQQDKLDWEIRHPH